MPAYRYNEETRRWVSTTKRHDSMHKIEGSVWCDRHGCVHDDELDPFNYGNIDEPGMCEPGDHRPVYIRRRKGDDF